MAEPSDPWELHIEAANISVQRATQGDVHAANRVVDRAVMALHGLMQFEEPDPNKLRFNVLDMADSRKLIFHQQPDPDALVCLRSILLSLKAIQSGIDPETALHLKKPDHRLADPNLGLRDVLLFVLVGQHFERLAERGHTRQDKPVAESVKAIAKKLELSVATVDKAWKGQGGAKAWSTKKADWK